MELAAVPFARHQSIVLYNRLFQYSHVSLTILNGCGNHCLVLKRGVILRDRRGRRAIKCSGPAARCGVGTVAGARGAIRVTDNRKTSEDRGRHLPVCLLYTSDAADEEDS